VNNDAAGQRIILELSLEFVGSAAARHFELCRHTDLVWQLSNGFIVSAPEISKVKKYISNTHTRTLTEKYI
jgi:hypothetical protein